MLGIAASYDLANRAPIATQQFVIPRSAQVQRKPAPPLLTVNTNLSVGQVGPPVSGPAVNLSASPSRGPNPYSPPRVAGGVPISPRQGAPTNSALGHARTASDGTRQSARTMTSVSPSMLEYARPPVAPPLPDEFGSANQPLPDSPKVLKVVNL